MKWFFAIFFSFSAVFLSIFGINCIYGNLFPTKYNEEISSSCEEFYVDKAVIFSLINIESHFNKNALSSKGAVGLMQIMPSTADSLAEELNLSGYDLYDEDDNIKIGAYYVSKLLNRFSNLHVALCAYNAGPTTVSGWLKNEDYSNDGKTLKNIPYAETKNYILKFEKNFKYYKSKSVCK